MKKNKVILIVAHDSGASCHTAALIHALNNMDGKVLIADGKMTTVDLSKPETFKYEIGNSGLELRMNDNLMLPYDPKPSKGVKALNNYLHNQNNKKHVRKHMLKHTKRKK